MSRWMMILGMLGITFGCVESAKTEDGEDTLAKDQLSGGFSYDAYSNLLQSYVDDTGRVDYAGLNTNRQTLDATIRALGEVSPAIYDAWTPEEKLAFWINAYNVITLERIVNHYPIKKGGLVSGLRYPQNSIRQISGVWDKLETNVAGRSLTLDAIEHQILRKEFREPRIHVAIVCASVGCPPLRNEPFFGARIDEQLADQSRKFAAGEQNVRIDRETNHVYLSSIFDWFGEDFVEKFEPADGYTGHSKSERAVLHFVAQHSDADTAAYLAHEKYRVSFVDYDWALNEQ